MKEGPQGGEVWNPLTSGKTTLATRFFYTYRDLSDFDDEDSEQLEAKTNGLDFWIEYDNTDFPRNPTEGSRQQFMVSRDFGWFDSSNSWTNLELDMAKYFNLGTSSWFKQQVLALNFWTSNTPTWETNSDNPQQVTHRPAVTRRHVGVEPGAAGGVDDLHAVALEEERRVVGEGHPRDGIAGPVRLARLGRGPS